MLIAVTFGSRLSSPSSTAFSRMVICAPTLASTCACVPVKITSSLPSRASAVKSSSGPTVSPDRVPAHTPSGVRSRVAVASGSWWLPRALSPATVTVTDAMSAWLPLAEASTALLLLAGAMTSGPATRTVTDVIADGLGVWFGGGPADDASSRSSMHPARDTRTISVASGATRRQTVRKTLMDLLTGAAALALQLQRRIDPRRPSGGRAGGLLERQGSRRGADPLHGRGSGRPGHPRQLRGGGRDRYAAAAALHQGFRVPGANQVRVDGKVAVQPIQEVANVVHFLCSEEASFVTGHLVRRRRLVGRS